MMARAKAKAWWRTALQNVTGDLSTALFRVMTTIGFALVLSAWSKVQDIYNLPEAQARAVVEQKLAVHQLKDAMDDIFSKFKSMESQAHSIQDWEKDRSALMRMVESHDNALRVQEGKLDNILRVQEKILEQLIPK